MSQPDCKTTNSKLDATSSLTIDSPMSKFGIMKNLLILGVGFMFLFSAFRALAKLQSTMNNVENVGVASLSAFGSSLIVSSFFLPELIIKRFGCKFTLVLSVLMFSPYIAANFYPTMSILLPTAILSGVGASNLWSSANSYINELSFIDARQDTTKAVLSTSKFFGIFEMFFQAADIWGNLVSYFVLSPSTAFSVMYPNKSMFDNANFLKEDISNISCGAEFCGAIDQKLTPLSNSKRFTLIGIFVTLTLIAAAILLLFLDPLKQDHTNKDESSVFKKLAVTFNHMKKTDQLLLIILSIFVGLQQGFAYADYSEAYVACTIGLQNVGLVFVCFGVVSAITAVIIGRLLKYIPRIVVIMTAAASNFGVCVVLLCWKPDNQQVSMLYILISFWGFSDATWQTQMCALYGVLFRNDEEVAFASFRLWEAAGFLIAYSCSSYLCTSLKIYILISFLVTGMAGYIALEIKNSKKNNVD